VNLNLHSSVLLSSCSNVRIFILHDLYKTEVHVDLRGVGYHGYHSLRTLMSIGIIIIKHDREHYEHISMGRLEHEICGLNAMHTKYKQA